MGKWVSGDLCAKDWHLVGSDGGFVCGLLFTHTHTHTHTKRERERERERERKRVVMLAP